MKNKALWGSKVSTGRNFDCGEGSGDISYFFLSGIESPDTRGRASIILLPHLIFKRERVPYS